MPRKLTVVAPGDQPPAPPSTIKAAAEHSERALLVALRAKIAAELDTGVPAAYLAPVSRQLREIDQQLRALDARAEQEAAEDGNGHPDEAWDAEAL